MKNKLNVLPDNPDETSSGHVKKGRFPKWLHRQLPKTNALFHTHSILNSHRLPTVCEEAKCPNLIECYSKKTATFLAMGKTCTRSCPFCSIDFAKQPKPLEADEPERLADSVKELGLTHVVITMVARDDLEDGGASHLVRIIEKVREKNQNVTIEVLTSDFSGNFSSLDTVLEARPEIFNHNIETTRLLTPKVRHKATYERSLSLLSYVKGKKKALFVKSGLMLGLGESKEEIEETLNDLCKAGCDIVTMGQYLQPEKNKLSVKAFIPPEEFDKWSRYGQSIGIKHVYAGPFVRSSYNAKTLFESMSEAL